MNNLKQKHKDYLIKNEIKDLTDLVNYVEILRNTSNLQGEDRQMLFDFAFLIVNEQSSLKSFFAENKNPSKEFYNAFKKFAENENKNSPTFMDEVLEQSNREKCNPLDELHERAGREMFNTIKDEDGQFNSTSQVETHTEVPNFNESVGFQMKRGKVITYKPKEQVSKYKASNLAIFKLAEDLKIKQEIGKKESQTVKKAPIFTFCKQMKNAIEEMAFRTEYGHNKYIEFDADYNNFARVDNGDEEYANAQFRHALGIGEDSELEHYVASAWDAVARLEIYLRNNKS